LHAGLADLAERRGDVVAGVRGRGLMLGLQLHVPPATFNKACFERGLLAVPAGDDVVRLLPPLVVTDAEIDEALSLLDHVAAEFARAA
jgi:acetylornithine/N-succinyldiaminopimelate aminotransferase